MSNRKLMLIVEDDPDFLLLATEAAARSDWDIHAVAEFPEHPMGVLGASGQLPDAAIIDYAMGEFVGLPIYRMLDTVGVPSIIWTSLGVESVLAHIDKMMVGAVRPPIVTKCDTETLDNFCRSPRAAVEVIKHGQKDDTLTAA